ncbi:MAG: AMP-binding protein [Bryobacteraceae bacterium]
MASQPSKWIWEPDPAAIPRTNVFRFMQRLGFDDREAFLRYSTEHLAEFWDAAVRELNLHWFEPYTRVLDDSNGPEWARWFIGGKINIAHNCLDRHVARTNPAVIWEAENGSSGSISFQELEAQVNRLANALAELGLKAGDRVALCMPMCPEIVTVLYACFKSGLVAVPIFAGFGLKAIADRLADSGAKIVFTADYLERRGKLLPLKTKIDEALESAPGVKLTVVLRYRGAEIPWSNTRDRWWHDLLDMQSINYNCLPLDAESTALLLYTSGTTGKPKGAVHTHAGTLAQTAKEIYLAFDHQPDDRFFWLTDIGWMMGPWAIIGNHNFGGTIFLYDGAPDFPAPDRLWQIVERHRITMLGISPTAIRILMRHSQPDRGNLSSLRLLGSTGEPWDETSYRWFFENVGRSRCPIINISGGTEIVGCFLLVLPIQPLKPCTLGGPSPGMAAEVVDEAGLPIRGKHGYLVCTKPAPSMTKGLWNDRERYLECYWSPWKGWWNHGDWASVDEDGCWFLHGRADESLNVAGRKVGPAEVEEALIEHPAVAEAAAIGIPDELTGEALAVFCVLKPGRESSAQLSSELCQHLIKSLGPTFKPASIRAVPELPKTQSGKIVRRAIRRKFLGQDPGDISTIENPRSLEYFS